jgi:putative transposase
VSYRINQQRNSPGASIWQQRFHDKIIRNETMLNAIRQYIQANPARWSEASENPVNMRSDQGRFKESG